MTLTAIVVLTSGLFSIKLISGQSIGTPPSLVCDFESTDRDCDGWHNETIGVGFASVEWSVAGSGLVLDAWHSIPRPAHGEHFAYTVGRGQAYPHTARLTSNTIPCLHLPSSLQFDYWKNAFLSGIFQLKHPELRVLIRSPPGTNPPFETVRNIVANNAAQWRSASVDIPPISKPFQLIIEATTQGAFDIVGIDNIFFLGYIEDPNCELNLEALRATPPSTTANSAGAYRIHNRLLFQPNAAADTTTAGTTEDSVAFVQVRPNTVDSDSAIPKEHLKTQQPTVPGTTLVVDYNSSALCTAVNCGFENENCGYEGTKADDGAWMVVQGRVGEADTGVSRAAFGRFYVVGYTTHNSSQVLRSRPFRTTESRTFLTFWYAFAHRPEGRFVVCDRRLDNCLWERKGEGSQRRRRRQTSVLNRWRRGVLLLTPGEHQIMFVVEKLTDGFVALDQIYLRQKLSGPPTSCEQSNVE